MRQPAAGDAVLHFVTDKWANGLIDKRIAGISTIVRPAEETNEEPPRAGPWAHRTAYYRILLCDFLALLPALRIRELEHAYDQDIVAEIIDDQPRYYPFSR